MLFPGGISTGFGLGTAVGRRNTLSVTCSCSDAPVENCFLAIPTPNFRSLLDFLAVVVFGLGASTIASLVATV